MPKFIIHCPVEAFDEFARRQIATHLTNLALECEKLPTSPSMKSSVWIYFNSYENQALFIGEEFATLPIVSVQMFALENGLDADAKKRLITEVTQIIGRFLQISDRVPVYICIQEIPEANWATFGLNPSLSSLRSTTPGGSAS